MSALLRFLQRACAYYVLRSLERQYHDQTNMLGRTLRIVLDDNGIVVSNQDEMTLKLTQSAIELEAQQQSKVTMSPNEVLITNRVAEIKLAGGNLDLTNGAASIKMSPATVSVNDGALDVT